MTTRAFKDIEVGLLDWLKATFPELADDTLVDEHVGTEPIPGLDQRLPFVVVDLVSGTDNFFTQVSVVGIDVFGATRTQSYALAESIRAKLLGPLLVVGGIVVDLVVTRTLPTKAPWDERIHRRRAEYEISTRR